MCGMNMKASLVSVGGRGAAEGGMGGFYMHADMQGGVATRQGSRQSILHVI